MIRKFKKFRKLPFKEKMFFFEAYLTVGIMRAAVLRIPIEQLTRSLKHQQNDMEIVPLGDKEMQTAISVGRAISRAAAHTPWESTCLAQSFTARRMLQKRGIPGVFYLGVAKNAERREQIEAHSWSQCGDMIVTGGEGHENFTVLSMFGWPGK